MKILKFIALLLFLTGISACKNDDAASLNNIEDLYAQPLPVIKKCVQGKWKWLYISQDGVIGFIPLSHTFVEITNDNIIINQDRDEDVYPKGRLSYQWINKEVFSYMMSQDSISTYVMQFGNGQSTTGWYFHSVKNDSLYVCVDFPDAPQFHSTYLFSKIK